MKRSKALMGLLAVAAVLVLSPSAAFAADGGASSAGAYAAIAAGIGLGIAVLGGALGQGKAASAMLEGLARNPGASDKMFTPFILGMVLIESLVIYSLVIGFQLVGKI
jgi:F-type H+-transporting ATPase subunit c